MKSMKISFIITSYSGSNETVLMKIIKMLFCKDNNESVWKDVEIVKEIFHNYIRNDENDVEAVEHILKVDNNLISRDVMNNIEIVNIFDDHIDYGEEHSSSTLHMVESLQKYYESINFNNYQIIISKEYSSPGCSRNIASRKATGDYIFFIDDDDYYINMECLYNNVIENLKEKDYDFILYTRYVNESINITHYDCTWNKCIKRSKYIKTFESPELWYEMFPLQSWLYAFSPNIKINTHYNPIMYFISSDRHSNDRDSIITYIRTLQNINKYEKVMTKSEIYSLLFINMYITIMCYNFYRTIFYKDFPKVLIYTYNIYNSTYFKMYNKFLPTFDDLEYIPKNLKIILDLIITDFNIPKLQELEENQKNPILYNNYLSFIKKYCNFHILLNRRNIQLLDEIPHPISDPMFVPISYYLQRYKNPNLLREFTILTHNTQHIETHCIGNHDHSIQAFLSSHNLEFSIKNNDFILKHSGYKLL